MEEEETSVSFNASLYQKTRDSKHFLFVTQRVLTFLQRHPILNLLSSVLLYLFMFLQDILVPLYYADTREDTDTTITAVDVITYFVAFTPYRPRDEDLKHGMICAIICCLLCFLTVMLCFTVHELYSGICIGPMTVVSFYFLPVIVVGVIGCFERGYDHFSDHEAPAIAYVGYFFHIGLLAWLIVVACFFSSSGFVVGHVLIARSPVKGLIVIGHILWVSGMRGIPFPFNKLVTAASCALNLAVVIFYIADPPFYSGVLNCVADAFCFYHVTTGIYWLLDGYGKMIHYYFLIPAFGVSLIINFLIYPFCVCGRRKLLFAFISSRKQKCLDLLESFECDDASTEDLWNAVIISLYYHLPITQSWLEKCTIELRTSLDQLFRFWTTMNLHQSQEGKVLESYRLLFIKWKNGFEAGEKLFWHQAWLSDSSTLPKLAAYLGRTRHFIEDNVTLLGCGKLTSSQDMRTLIKCQVLPGEEQPKHKNCCRTWGPNETLSFVTVLVLLVIAIVVFWVSLRSRHYADIVTYLFGLTDFNFDWVNGYTGAEDLPSVRESWIAQVEYLNSLKGDPEYGFLEEMMSKQTSYGLSCRDGMENMVQALENATEFPIATYFQFAQVFDETLSFLLTTFMDYNAVRHRNFANYGYNVVGGFWAFSTLYLFIAIIVDWRKQKRMAERFRLIDHKIFFELGRGFDDEEDPLYVFPVDENIAYLRSYPVTAIYNCVFFVSVSVFAGLALAYRAGAMADIAVIERAMIDIADINRIALWFYCGTMAGFASDPELYSAAWKLASKKIVEVMFRGQIVSEQLLLYNDSLSAIIGESLLQGQNSLSTNETYDLASQFYASSVSAVTAETKLGCLYERIFAFHLIYASLCAVVMLTVMMKLRPVVLAERAELAELYKEASELEHNDDSYELETSEEDVVAAEDTSKFKIANLPVPLILVDEDLKVKKATRMACQDLQIKVKRTLFESCLTVGTLEFIESTIAKYKQDLSEEFAYFNPGGDGQDSLVLQPIYMFKKGHLKFKQVMAIFMKNYSLNSEMSNKRFHDTFHSVYPSFVEETQTFPHVIPSNNKPSLFIMIKLLHFHEWAKETSPELVEYYRNKVSSLVFDSYNSENKFFKVRETGDQILLLFNQLNTTVTVWKILQSGADLVKDILKGIKILSKEYENNVIGRAIMLKCRDPGYYFSDMKMSLMDFTEDFAIVAEQYQDNVRPETIGYATYKKEMKVQNTTLYKSCRTASGNEYDLFIFV